MIVITGSLFQLFGPLSGVHGNSVYYSGEYLSPASNRPRLGVNFHQARHRSQDVMPMLNFPT
jgi:hypothetical protein